MWNKITKYGILNNANSKYLYRGLREEEVAEGIKLIPKGIQTFKDVKLVIANASGYYDFENIGPVVTIENHIKGLPTAGISVSTNKKIAIAYALFSPIGKQYVVTIDREKTRLFGITEIVVKEILPLWVIEKPDDDEVILVSETGIFPKDIIEIYEKL